MTEKKPIIWGEIASQAETVRVTSQRMLDDFSELARTLRGRENLHFLGCGSSYHAALMAAHVFNDLLDRGSASATVCSDFITYPELHLKRSDKKDLFVLISRTGKTTEPLIAADILKKRGFPRLSITTFADSDLALAADSSLTLAEAREESITATRSVTSTTVALLALVSALRGDRAILQQLVEGNDGFFRGFEQHSTVMSRIINGQDVRKIIFLGAGPFYGLAKEAELKVKEMSLTDTEANQPLEFRHGHKSILDARTLVVLFASSEGLEFEKNTLAQLRPLGARLLVVCGRDEGKKLQGLPDSLIPLDNPLTEQTKLIYYQVFGQLAGYYQALKKGIDPSNPKNLDYYVTF